MIDAAEFLRRVCKENGHHLIVADKCLNCGRRADETLCTNGKHVAILPSKVCQCGAIRFM